MTMARLMLWTEMLSSWQHYMVELKEAGIQREEMEEKLFQMTEEQKTIPEGHHRMQELGEKLLQDRKEIQNMIERVYK